MKGFFFFLTLVSLPILFAVSCNKSSSPVSPEGDEPLNRQVQAFPAGSVPIFSPELYHNIDLAQIRGGWGSNGAPFYPITGCAAVTLRRQDNTTANPFKPQFRWLDSTIPGPGWGPAPVADRDADDPNDPADYRNPKCAALLDLDQSFIELAVCYQVRNYEDQDPIDWDIGVTRLLWFDNLQGDYFTEFPDLGPAQRIDRVLDDPDGDVDWDEMNPDIAYDYLNGDIYVVYENAEAPQIPTDPTQVRLKYRRFARDQMNHMTGLWPGNNAEWYAQTHDGELVHNGYTPSIEVGLLDLSLLGIPLDNVNYVVIAYTSQFMSGHLGYHVAVTAWNASGMAIDRETALQLRNPQFRDQNAGLPCVSITPNQTTVNFAAVVFQQVTGVDAYGPVNRIYEVDMTSCTNLDPLSWQYFVVQTGLQGLDDGLYPSIALHEETTIGGQPATNASITFLAQYAQQAMLDPLVVRLGIIHPDQNTPPPPPWQHAIGYRAFVDQGSIITGNYNIDHIPILDPGAATTVVFGPNSTYWASWCDRVEMEDPPETVWAAFGNAQ